MSQQVDANLVELVRKWLDKLMPYRRADEALISVSSCDTILPFLLSLLNNGCKPIGISKDNVYIYMRCGDKLVSLHILLVVTSCPEDVKSVVGKAPKLSEEQERELVDKRSYGSIVFEGTGVNLSVFWNEPVFLGTLKDIPLYLEGVWLHAYYPKSEPPGYDLLIRVNTVNKEGKRKTIGLVEYKLEEGEVKRKIAMLWPKLRELEPEQEESKKLLAVLNAKWFIMDELIREVADMFIRGFKSIVIAVLY